MDRSYIAIDLKSFYASVECVERGFDPLNTNLVVADISRTSKTICLAVSPSLKARGVSGRPRLFEVEQTVAALNASRKGRAGEFSGKSYIDSELKKDDTLAIDYYVAPPQMAKYMDFSNRIYNIYLKYVAPSDIHVYSIDEVFIDATDYLNTYGMDARGLAEVMIKDVLESTGITATVGIGTNLYLCKIAMDIWAKHMEPDKNGARIAFLDEISYRKNLWDHKPLSDFWRIGRGYSKRLKSIGLYTMGDIARCSLKNEDLLFKLFGINAELLIDHAWGYEPCTISDIKDYVPKNSSVSSGQVLTTPYSAEKAGLVVKEMADVLSLELVYRDLVTDQLVLTIGYDISNLMDPAVLSDFHGDVKVDHYGRLVPKHAHGTRKLSEYTASSEIIISKFFELYNEIVNRDLLIRRMYVVAGNVIHPGELNYEQPVQLSLFDMEETSEHEESTEDQTFLHSEKERIRREESLQKAVLEIKMRYGKNAILKGMNLEEGGTTVARNGQVGGHRA